MPASDPHGPAPKAEGLPPVPEAWAPLLSHAIQGTAFVSLSGFVAGERARHEVFPRHEQVFHALRRTSPAQTRVVIVGQDPYHGPGQAHGLSFSVPPGVTKPPSLRNMLRELHDDLGMRVPNSGCLIPWTEQGVLLLNTVLTVRAHQANSHRGRGWESFTDAVLRVVASGPSHVVFVLWGTHAQKKRALIEAHHTVIESAHPSPLSARQGFLGSRPYSRINAALRKHDQPVIDWRLDP